LPCYSPIVASDEGHLRSKSNPLDWELEFVNQDR
jgi:hypothetical protein